MTDSFPGVWIRALRPRQWTKNAVVFAAFLFSLGDPEQEILLADGWRAAAAAVLFCIISSAVYLLNDVRDAPQDRLHPEKKQRPVASGALSPVAACLLSSGLLAAGLIGGFLLQRTLGFVLLGYVALQILYTFALKRLALVDLLVIASGFVLRAIAGAVALPVAISPWLLVCTFLLALFLILCKRRQEKAGQAVAHQTRPTLLHYDETLLDQLIAIIAAATLVSYAIYTLAPETQAKFGSARLGFTIPFVVFGLFRYLDLVYRKEEGEQPEEVLLTDLPMILNIVLFGAVVLLILL